MNNSASFLEIPYNKLKMTCQEMLNNMSEIRLQVKKYLLPTLLICYGVRSLNSMKFFGVQQKILDFKTFVSEIIPINPTA